MTATTKLALELLANAAANQTLANTTFAQLNQLVQAGVVDKDLATPPGSPANEALYIVAGSPTGAWSGKAGQLAYWLTSTGAWQFIVPREGFLVHVNDENDFYKYDGAAWSAFSASGGGGADAFGCLVQSSASLSVPNTTLTYATFTTEIVDNGSMADLGSANDRITIAEDGIYLVFGTADLEALATNPGTANARVVRVSDSRILAIQGFPNFNGGSSTLFPVGVYPLTAGDQLRLGVFHTSGATRSARGSSTINYSLMLGAFKL